MKRISIKREPSEREKMIDGFVKRVAHKKKQLAATKKWHHQVEIELARKLRRDEIQLKALKASKP